MLEQVYNSGQTKRKSGKEYTYTILKMMTRDWFFKTGRFQHRKSLEVIILDK